jgi:hypothetical protein
MTWSIVQGKQLPAGYVKICCKSVAVEILALLMKKAAKRKCLTAKNLSEWAGVDLNHRHTDFQSVALPTELPARKNQFPAKT